MASDVEALSEHEGMLLALLIRQQPTTSYKLFKMFEGSPVSSINGSKGQLYPAIRRLKARGLVVGRQVEGDRRNVEELEVTQSGIEAARRWVIGLGDGHVVLDDPLRTRMLSLDLLSREERLEWIATAKQLVKQRGELLDQYNESVSVPYQHHAYRSSKDLLRVKMEWLDELLYEIAKMR